MARHKEFEPEEALDTAMRLFWRRGYEATSTADLVQELGIARASLYATFGSKRDLYVAALDRFLSTGPGGAALTILRRDGSALAAIRDFLMTSAAPLEATTPPGCFAVNATVEHADLDPDIALRLDANRRRTEAALLEALTSARTAGEVPHDLDLRATAVALSTLNAGLKVSARAGEADQGQTTRTIDTLLAAFATTMPDTN